MPFFAAQIWTGREGKYLSLLRAMNDEREEKIVWPRRTLRICRAGKWRDSCASIFPGYVFVIADRIPPELYWEMRGVPGFLRFLPANKDIQPMSGKDQELLSHFLAFGEIVDKSRVIFDENRRIKVVSGPLKGLEGLIIKVDKRKRRAKVRLELYRNTYPVDFGFEFLESVAGEPGERA